MRRLAALVCLAVACGGAPKQEAAPAPAAAADDSVAEIVRLEGRREGSARLRELAAQTKPPALRRRALLALGRIGDAGDINALVGALGDADATIRDAAAEALGLAGAEGASRELGAVLDATPSEALAAALGHVATDAASAQRLTTLLASSDAKLRAAGARALGSMGQRKQTVPDAAIEALATLAASEPEREVRYAIAYALFRARGDATLPDPARAALERLATDGGSDLATAETRAVAVRGLAAHHQGRQVFVTALADADWRVRVEGVRGLGGAGSDASSHAVLAEWTAKQIGGDASLWDDPRAHAVLEALTLLAPSAAEPGVTPLFKGAAKLVDAKSPHVARTAAWLQVEAGLVRLGAASVEDLGRASYQGAQLALDIVAEKKAVTEAQGWKVVDALGHSADARVRAAAAAAAVSFLPMPAAGAAVVAALRDPEAMVVGSVADALAEKGAPVLDDSLLAAASDALVAAKDPEVATSLVHVVCAAPERASAYAPALHAAHGNPSAVVRAAARECLTKVLGADPGAGVASSAEPRTPADPTRLLGQRVTWTVTTTQGVFVVALDPDLAPWNVGTITALAEKHFYDGTLWHRVVPDFVVQGGDPTGSGWGGPGYTVPAETSQRRYLRGTVGIADAGKDTGGSQWFVMHAAAPHLEQRYTIVGEVTRGMEVVDRLNVGDGLVRVDVKLEPETHAP